MDGADFVADWMEEEYVVGPVEVVFLGEAMGSLESRKADTDGDSFNSAFVIDLDGDIFRACRDGKVEGMFVDEGLGSFVIDVETILALVEIEGPELPDTEPVIEDKAIDMLAVLSSTEVDP